MQISWQKLDLSFTATHEINGSGMQVAEQIPILNLKQQNETPWKDLFEIHLKDRY